MTHWQFTSYVFVTLLTALLSAVFALFAWRRRPTPGATPAALLLAAATVWSLGYAFELATPELASKLFWAKVQYPGIVTVPVGWLTFVLHYTGRPRWLTLRHLGILLIVPLITVLLVWTNERHGLIWHQTQLMAGASYLGIDAIYGRWFWIHTAYSYVLFLTGLFLLLPMYFRQAHLYRSQVSVVLLGALLPFLVNILYIFRLSPIPRLDLTPFAFIASGFGALWGLFGFRLLDRMPGVRKSVLDSLEDIVIVLDAQKRIADINSAAQPLITLPVIEAVGQPLSQVLVDQAGQLLDFCDDSPTQQEIALRLDSGLRHFDLTVSPLHDNGSRRIGWLLVMRDISGHKRTEQALRESERQYRTLVETMNDGLSVLDEQGVFTYVNDQLCRMLGYERNELVGRAHTDFLDEANQQILEAQLARRRAGQREPYELEWTVKDGRKVATLISPVPIYDDEDRFEGSFAVINDITERKQADEALRESEQKFRTLAKVNPVSVIIFRGKRMVYVNPAAVALTGYDKVELLSKNFWDVVHPDFQETVRERGLARQRGESVPTRYELKLLTKAGRECWVDATLSVIEYEGKPAVLGAAMDITDRKRSETERERLLAAEREQRLLAETLGEVFLALTAQTSREAVLDEILRQAKRVVPHSAANIMLLEDNVLRVVRSQGYQSLGGEELLADLEQSLADFPLDATVVQSGEPLIVADTLQTPEWVAMAETAWIRSFVAVPLRLQERVLGLLRLDSETPDKFSAVYVERLQPLAHAAAIALENARLYDQIRQELGERRRAEMEARELNRKLFTLQVAGTAVTASLELQDVLNTVTQEMTNLLEAEGCAISEWDRRANTVSLITEYDLRDRKNVKDMATVYDLAEYPLTRQVLVTRQPEQMTISQADIDPAEQATMQMAQIRTLLMLPMEFQGNVVGLVEIMDSRAERVYSADEIALAQLLANQAAIAIQNARLYDQTVQVLTERIEAERKLSVLASRNKAILNAIPDAMFYFSSDGELLDHKIVSDSRQSPDILKEIVVDPQLGETLSLPSGLSNPTLPDLIKHILQTSELESFEYQLSSSQGIQDFEVRLVNSGPNEILAMVRDITESKQTMRELRDSEERFRKIFEEGPLGMSIIDLDYRYIRANRRLCQMLGYSEEELRALTFLDLTHPDDIDRNVELIEQMYRGETPSYRIEKRFLRKDKKMLWVALTASAVRDAAGEIIYLLAMIEDITARKQAEADLQRSEANLRAIFDQSQQPFVLIDREYKVRAFNKVATEGLKQTIGQEFKEGHSIYNLIPEPDLEEFNHGFGTALQGEPVSFEKKVHVEDREIWFEYTYYPVFTEAGQVIGACFSAIDIDERKRAADALAASEARLVAEMHSVLAISRALVSEIDLDRLLEFVVNQAEALTNADGAAVLLLSEDGQHLEVMTPGQTRLSFNGASQIPLNGSVVDLAYSSRIVQIGHYTEDDDRISSVLAPFQLSAVQSILCAPLVIQNRHLGLLLIWSEETETFSEADVRLMGLFADQAALALENARLHVENQELAVEQERHRLARELHDSVTQSIYSIGLAAQASMRLLGAEAAPALEDALGHIHTLSQRALLEIREQLFHLHPTTLDEDLVEALTQHCHTLRKQHNLDIVFTTNLARSLSDRRRNVLYFIAREGLWNIIKHARADQVTLDLSEIRRDVVMTIEDDGVGFDPLTITQTGKMGLRNMDERAKSVGGRFELKSKPAQGTKLTVRVPVDANLSQATNESPAD